MFKDVITLLLEGGFICNVAHPTPFAYLQDEGARREVDGYLARLDRRLAITPHDEAYYAAHASVGLKERPEIRTLFKEVKHDLRPVLGFLNLVMQAKRADMTLGPGDVIEFPVLLMQVSDNPHLGEALRGFSRLGNEFAASEASPRAMLDKLLQRLTKNGYLVTDKEHDRYQVTGKIDYFYEVMNFLIENEEEVQDATATEPEGETGRLF